MRLLLALALSWSVNTHALELEGLDEKIRDFVSKYQPAPDTGVAIGVVQANADTDWRAENFLSWISGQGFHIELTGDEFELYGSGIPSA